MNVPRKLDPGKERAYAIKRAIATDGLVDIPILVNALGDDVPEVKIAACEALTRYRELPSEVIEPLMRLMKDANREVRRNAIMALRNVVQPTPELVDAVLPNLFEYDDFLRSTTAYSLGRIGRGNDKVVSALIAALDDSYDYVVIGAIDSLGEFGPDAISSVETLQRYLKGDDKYRLRAAYAIYRITGDTETTIPIIITFINTPRLCGLAIYDLGQVGPDARAALPALKRRLKWTFDKGERETLEEAISRIEGRPEKE